MGFPGGSVVNNLPAMQEMWVRSLGWEDPLEEEMATHSSIFDGKIPPTDEPHGLSVRLQRLGHDRACTHTPIWNIGTKFSEILNGF